MTTIQTDRLPDALLSVCKELAGAGGRAWLVGGCVRDMLSGIAPKDFDLEVYGLPADRLAGVLTPFGRTEHFGKSFGIIKLWSNGLKIDIALPRLERKTTSGHCGFSIETSPDLAPEKATLRRDFTINAMMLDPLTNELIDLHGGKNDLAGKLLRHVSSAFSEDPLRPLRAMQFAARFQLSLAGDTATLCQTMLAEAKTLPASRIWGEWQKWGHAPYPSFGLRALRESGWLSLYPELDALIDCPQDRRWHPEGDVWTHTLHACDQAAAIAGRNQLDKNRREQLLFATLCHDLGKPERTSVDSDKSVRSPGHSETGIEHARQLLRRISAPEQLTEHVAPLVREHMTHMHGEPTKRAIRRLAHRLEPVNIELWEMLVEADASGRPPAPASRPAKRWLDMAQNLAHHRNEPKAIIGGKMLLGLGLKPGPAMGKIIKDAYEAQLDGLFNDESSAIIWCRRNILRHDRRI